VPNPDAARAAPAELSVAPAILDGAPRVSAHPITDTSWSAVPSEQEAPPEDNAYLLAQVREAFGRVVYSHKTHEKQADLCFRNHRRQQAVLVVLTAAGSGTFLAAIVGSAVSPKIASLTTSFIALLVTAISLATKTFEFSKEADAHRTTAARLWDARESYLSLITDLSAGVLSAADARGRRDELQEAVRAAYADAPRTTEKAFARAGGGLNSNEEMTFTSGEIDLFLPEALRLNEAESRP
jgi:hypothetical protein